MSPRIKALAARVGPPVAALVLGIGAWEAGVRVLGVRAFILPPPSAIAAAGLADAGMLASATLETAKEALVGFAISALAGVIVAVVLGASRVLERALYPYTVFLQTVPIVAVAPLLVLWFGAGFWAITASAVIVSVFPVIANTLAGLRSVDPPLRDLFRLYGASRFATLFKLDLPASLPSIVTGLRIASGLAVIGAIVGEFVAGFSEGSAGLGIMVLSAYRQLRTDLLFAAVFAASLLGLGIFAVVDASGHLLLRRWHPSAK